MSLELLLALLVLALVDSTSVGTLLIPLWLLLTPGPIRSPRILVFLATVAAFYLVLGIVLLAGAIGLVETLGDISGSTPVRWTQLVIGVALMVLGIVMEPWTKAGKAARAARRAERERIRGPGRIARLRHQATDGSAPVATVLGLAVTAAAIEAASMLPYLGAIGLLATSDLSVVQGSLVLVGYCLVMITPALILLVLRLVAHDRVERALVRMEGWMSRNSREAVAWVMFLVGLLLFGDALASLDFT